MSAYEITDADRLTMIDAVLAAADPNGTSPTALANAFMNATEAIVARAVAAALESAACEIEAVDSVEWALAGRDAGLEVARIVRATQTG